MGKTFEALVKAENEYQEKMLTPVDQINKLLVPLHLKTDVNIHKPKWYEELKARLKLNYPDQSIKTLMFTGTDHGGGSSTVLSQFAYSLVKDDPVDVLLIDVNLRTPSLHKFFDNQSTQNLSDLFSSDCQFNRQCELETPGKLYVITCNGESGGYVNFFDSERFTEFVLSMRKRFDWVILDAPPVTHFTETLMLSRVVDGSILTIEAGKTRRQVTFKAKQDLEAAGGRFLGVILNKRRYVIPKWLYKRL